MGIVLTHRKVPPILLKSDINSSNRRGPACRFTYKCLTSLAPAMFGIIAPNSRGDRAFEFPWTLKEELGASLWFSWVLF